MLAKTRVLIILIIFFLTSNLVNASVNLAQFNESIEPYCSGKDAKNFLNDKSIKNIEIKVNNKKNWYTNIFKILVEFNSKEVKTENTGFFDFNISQKYKKKFKSNVRVNFLETNLSCDFKAEIRITGDLWWHLDWRKGVPVSSLHIKLINGHINNITQFKLLLPKSRGGEGNEIFVSSLLKELGFLSPKTFLVKTKINGHKIDYIFQEDLRKEFLESSNLIEGPILEGDERFTIDKAKTKKINIKLSLSRMGNSKYSIKSDTKNKTSLDAVSLLNQVYLQHHQTKKNDRLSYSPVDRLHIDTNKFFKNEKNKLKFQTYVALIYALDAQHSLSVDDIRLYFDPIYREYLPIFYDGKSNILNTKQKLKDKDLDELVSKDAKIGASQSINLINNLNDKKVYLKIKKNGVVLSFESYLNIKENILKRLKIISNSNPSEITFLETKKYFSTLNQEDINNEDLKIIFVDYENKSYFICELNQKNCKKIKINSNEFLTVVKNLIKQDFTFLKKDYKNTEFLYVYSNLNYSNIDQKNFNLFKELSSDNFTIKYNDGVEINLIEEKKEISIKQKNNYGRTIITGNQINSWTILLDGSNENLNLNASPDYQNLTGCLTFLDIRVSNININSKNTNCEDSVNFIRVKGDINKINIINSKSDGLDMDFSNISINYLNFKNILNDCLDLSFGKYEISYLSADSCGDKGVSIGEKSTVILKDLLIKNTNIGLAAKDSSYALVEKSKIIRSPICFSTYRKKQEFAGAIVKIKSTNCKKDKFHSQIGSSIISEL